MLSFYLAAFEVPEDKQTFENFYTNNSALAMRAALRICGNNHAIAEDAVHMGFEQIIKDWENFLQLSCDKQRSRFVIILKNKTIDILRQEKHYVSID
jgi:RNA polymerase sigma-70 factor (ECF subfamily)